MLIDGIIPTVVDFLSDFLFPAEDDFSVAILKATLCCRFDSDILVRNKELSPTWLSAGILSRYELVTTLIDLLLHYNWTTVYVVTDPSVAYYVNLRTDFKSAVQKTKIVPAYREITSIAEQNLTSVLVDFAMQSRSKAIKLEATKVSMLNLSMLSVFLIFGHTQLTSPSKYFKTFSDTFIHLYIFQRIILN